jgi:methylmalonyl-CoA mutase N-terminal domain/subunit
VAAFVLLLLPTYAARAIGFLADAEAVPVRQIDNSAVLSAQLARLAQVKASRDDAAVAAALQAIEAAARSSERQPNLLELAVQVGSGSCCCSSSSYDR